MYEGREPDLIVPPDPNGDLHVAHFPDERGRTVDSGRGDRVESRGRRLDPGRGDRLYNPDDVHSGTYTDSFDGPNELPNPRPPPVDMSDPYGLDDTIFPPTYIQMGETRVHFQAPNSTSAPLGWYNSSGALFDDMWKDSYDYDYDYKKVYNMQPPSSVSKVISKAFVYGLVSPFYRLSEGKWYSRADGTPRGEVSKGVPFKKQREDYHYHLNYAQTQMEKTTQKRGKKRNKKRIKKRDR